MNSREKWQLDETNMDKHRLPAGLSSSRSLSISALDPHHVKALSKTEQPTPTMLSTMNTGATHKETQQPDILLCSLRTIWLDCADIVFRTLNKD